MQETPLSILNEDGSCAEADRAILSDDALLAILKTVIMNRVIDRRFVMLQRQGRLGFYMTSTGEEAVTVGASACLRNDDPLFISYREVGSLLWRGVPLEALLNQMIANNQDPSKGRQMPVHYCYREYGIPSVSSPVGTQLPHATGYGYAARIRGTGQVALAFLGEGTASQGDFHMALNFAGVLRSPTVIIIRNNGYAISTPESVQTAAKSLASRAEGYGLPGYRIDGNDILAVTKTVQEAVDRARAGEGPTLIEALTYRLGAHSSADDPTRYRPEAEEAAWQKLDAMRRIIAHAIWRGIWSEEMTEQTRLAAEEETTRTIAACEKWPPPRTESMFDDVLAVIPDSLQEQKDNYFHYLRDRESRRLGGG